MTDSLLLGIDFFVRALTLLKPRIYNLAEVRSRPVVVYSDAEWTVLPGPQGLRKGLGGIMWADEKCFAAALDTPIELVEALQPRKTQIIPLELMAAAGMLETYPEQLRGREVIFFIDNQSVCCALCNGASKATDIQTMTTGWHLAALHLGCRIWIEWVPSEENPADVLSRWAKCPDFAKDTPVDLLRLPEWVDLRNYATATSVLDLVAGHGVRDRTTPEEWRMPPRVCAGFSVEANCEPNRFGRGSSRILQDLVTEL